MEEIEKTNNTLESILYGAIAGGFGTISLIEVAEYAINRSIGLQMRFAETGLYQKIVEDTLLDSRTILTAALGAGCFAGASAALSVYYAIRQGKKE